MIQPVTLHPSFQVLLVDDEPAWLRSLSLTLERAGISNIASCQDSRKVLPLLEKGQVGLILLDLTMPGYSGEELLEIISERYPDIMVIIISGMNELDTAVRCIKKGAVDYFVKTDMQEHITKGVLRAISSHEMKLVAKGMGQRLLSNKLEHPEAFDEIITCSNSMFSLFKYMESVAISSQPVLVTGESGVGKELVARAIHTLSERRGKRISLNVAGLDTTSFSDTLFGHHRGAFTGAHSTRPGLIEQARGGSLFLDEIGDLDLQSQVKLLRLLQEGEYFPLGSDRPKNAQTRIIAATHQDLQKKVQEGRFRKDLYYRLCIHNVHIPPLRERKGDIPLLLDKFLQDAATEMGKKKPTVPPELLTHLKNYSFPGNVRELQGMVYDAVSTHKSHVLSMQSFLQAMHADAELHTEDSTEPPEPFAQFEDLPSIAECTVMLIKEAMKRADDNQTLASRMLGISQPALSKRLKQLKD